jgi:hypothetical protein
MKKVRLILTATIVFAAVGSALAFKARLSTGDIYECGSDNKCFLFDTSYDFDQNGTTFNNAALTTTNIAGQPCAGNCVSTVKATKQP